MCGIFGGYHQTRDELHRLACLNIKRGNVGFGGLAVTSNCEIIFRYSQPYDENVFVPGGDFVVCHSLAPTSNNKRIHPFETDRFILAHNGILLNHKEYAYLKVGPVDSQYLLGAIQFYVDEGQDSVQAIKLANNLFNGQRGCWLWDRFDKKLYLWRVMSSLYYREGFFSSAKFEGGELLKEGIIYEQNKNTLNEITSFNFNSPYQV